LPIWAASLPPVGSSSICEGCRQTSKQAVSHTHTAFQPILLACSWPPAPPPPNCADTSPGSCSTKNMPLAIASPPNRHAAGGLGSTHTTQHAPLSRYTPQ
jgi:hypothetical protein